MAKKSIIKATPKSKAAAADDFVEGSSFAVQPVAVTEPVKRGVGRPKGKTSNPDYSRITAWVPDQLLSDLKILAQFEKDMDDIGDVLESFIPTDQVKERLKAVGIVRE